MGFTGVDYRIALGPHVTLRENGELRPGDPSQSLHELFGLPPDWPGPEEFFERRGSASTSGAHIGVHPDAGLRHR